MQSHPDTPELELAIVTSLYRSGAYVHEFCERVHKIASKLTNSYEIIMVNDGCPDDSLSVARQLGENDPKIRVVELSKNFGHHRALMTGMEMARSKYVFLIDCDLEEPPEELARFWTTIKLQNVDVVYGVQDTRRGSFFEKMSGNIFYSLYNALSSTPVPRNFLNMRLMTAQYVQALIEHKDRELFLGGLFSLTGFVQIPLEVIKADHGKSSYSFRKRISLFLNSVTSFSSRPLIYISLLGLGIVFVSILVSLYLLYAKIFTGSIMPGWTSLVISVWFMGGVQLLCIGIIGIYVSKIFGEVKRRPYSVIRKIYHHGTEQPGQIVH